MGIGLGLLGVALAFGVWLALRTDPRETFALRTDHSVLGVTLGAEPLILGSAWQKALLKWDPTLAPRIGGKVLLPKDTKPDTFVIWENYGPSDGWSGPMPHRRFRCRDDLGNEWTQTVSVSMKDFDFEINRDHIFPHVLQNFPRRGKTIEVTPLDWQGNALPGGPVSVPNPLEGHYGRWPAASSNQSAAGNLSARLLGFQSGGTRRTAFERIPVDLVRLSIQGAAADWKAVSLHLTDVTGNSWKVSSHYSQLETKAAANSLELRFPRFDLSNEEAFKLRIVLVPVRDVPKSETTLLQSIPTPRPKRLEAALRTGVIDGQKVEVTQQLGVGATGVPAPGNRKAWLQVRAPDPNDVRVLLVRLQGQRLWETPIYFDPAFIPSHLGQFFVEAPEQTSSQQLSVQMALARTRTLEFIIPAPHGAPR